MTTKSSIKVKAVNTRFVDDDFIRLSSLFALSAVFIADGIAGRARSDFHDVLVIWHDLPFNEMDV